MCKSVYDRCGWRKRNTEYIYIEMLELWNVYKTGFNNFIGVFGWLDRKENQISGEIKGGFTKKIFILTKEKNFMNKSLNVAMENVKCFNSNN